MLPKDVQIVGNGVDIESSWCNCRCEGNLEYSQATEEWPEISIQVLETVFDAMVDRFVAFTNGIHGFWKPFIEVADEFFYGFLDLVEHATAEFYRIAAPDFVRSM